MKQVFLIKLSGESMSGSLGTGLDFNYIEKICRKIKDCHDLGVGLGIVCGGGNFFVVEMLMLWIEKLLIIRVC